MQQGNSMDRELETFEDGVEFDDIDFEDEENLLQINDNQGVDSEGFYKVDGTTEEPGCWEKNKTGWCALIVFFIVLAALMIALAAEPTTPGGVPSESAGDDVLIQSQKDFNSYRYMTLSNRMKAVLVSDPTAPKAAAAVSVRVGSWSDPASTPGLAHFCEHMLFMGTERYPDEHEYSNFLQNRGGSDNAYTDDQETTYYFEVDPPYLNEALDRFAPFFISPLFKEESVANELHAVDSEHKKNLLSDGWRFGQLQKNLSLMTFPYHKFGTGDESTLDTSTILDDLHKYNSKYYSSNLMTLSIYGRESLAELDKIAHKYFEAVPNKHTPRPSWTGLPFREFGWEVAFAPIKDSHSLRLMWQVDADHAYLSQSPSGYIAHLLGHESGGSVLHYLREKGWATGLSAGLSEDTEFFGLFEVSVALTLEGVKKRNEIVFAIFRYIDMLKTDGVKKEVWSEMIHEMQVHFDNHAKAGGIDLVSDLVSSMHTTPPKFLLGSPTLHTWAPLAITSTLKQLTPRRLMLYFSSSTLNETDLAQTEPWYGTHFSKSPIPEILLEVWGRLDASTQPDTNFHLPLDNPFMPESFDVLQSANTPDTPPTLLLNDSALKQEVWWKADASFKIPKIYGSALIMSPASVDGPMALVCNHLLSQFLHFSFADNNYLANLAGFGWSLANTDQGLVLDVVGYSDKFQVFMGEVIANIESVAPTSEKLPEFKQKFTDSLNNWKHGQPYHHATGYLHAFLEPNTHLPHELLASVEHCTLEDLQKHAAVWLDSKSTSVLLYGNVNRTNATALGDMILAMTGPANESLPLPIVPVIKLPPEDFLYQSNVLQEDEVNSATVSFYQVGPTKDRRATVTLDLIGNMIAEPCFDFLRTKHQLGYIAGCRIAAIAHVAGLMVLVQGESQPAHIQEQFIEEFLQNFWSTTIKNMGDKDFQLATTTLIDELEEPYTTLSEASEGAWAQIETHRYRFNHTREDVAIVNTLTKQDVRTFYSNYFKVGGAKRSKISIEIFGNNHTMDTPKGDAFNNYKSLPSPDLRRTFQKTVQRWPQGDLR